MNLEGVASGGGGEVLAVVKDLTKKTSTSKAATFSSPKNRSITLKKTLIILKIHLNLKH